MLEWKLPGGATARLRQAEVADADSLRSLYFETYGDRYGLPEVVDPERSRRTLRDPHSLWLLAEAEGRPIGSVIFAVEPRHRLGKSFGGVIASEYRGQRVMHTMIGEGLRRLLGEGGPCDLVYAVVRTFISLHFHRSLKALGYVDVGVFPNVRKVRRYETHGLKVCPGPEAFTRRRSPPRLIPEAETLYRIAASRLNLGEPLVEPIRLEPPGSNRIELFRAEVEDVEALRQKAGPLDFSFFPLHEANLLLSDSTGEVRAFLYFQARDGHASLLGLDTGGRERVEVLLSVADACEALGVKYLEILASAYEPLLQAQLFRAGWIPCAYFPAAERTEDGRRQDYVVTSRSFVPLHFRGLKLTEDVKPYLLEFYQRYTAQLWEELMDA